MRKIDWHILRKSITGKLEDEEKRELQDWLEESEENRRYYRKMEEFFTGAERGREIDVRGNFREFERKTYGRQRLLVVSVLKYAAVLIVLVGCVVLWRGTVSRERKHQLATVPGIRGRCFIHGFRGEDYVGNTGEKEYRGCR